MYTTPLPVFFAFAVGAIVGLITWSKERRSETKRILQRRQWLHAQVEAQAFFAERHMLESLARR